MREPELTLFLRHPKRLKGDVPKNSKVVRGDVLNKEQLNHAMVGQDIVYANLTVDDIDIQAQAIVAAMKTAGGEVRRCLTEIPQVRIVSATLVRQ